MCTINNNLQSIFLLKSAVILFFASSLGCAAINIFFLEDVDTPVANGRIELNCLCLFTIFDNCAFPFLYVAIFSMIVVMIISWLYGSTFLEIISYSEERIKSIMADASRKEYLDRILPQILTWENSLMGIFMYIINIL